jgi:hypothetical protein
VRRTLAVALILGLVGGALVAPAEAGKKKKKKKQRIERTVEGTYDLPTLVIAGSCSSSGAIGCVALPSAAKERFVTATVTDQHGQPVYVSVQADTDGNNQDDEVFGSFCGETDEPIAIQPGTELHFWVGFSPDPGFAGCVPGFATSGSIEATFSNLP